MNLRKSDAYLISANVFIAVSLVAPTALKWVLALSLGLMWIVMAILAHRDGN